MFDPSDNSFALVDISKPSLQIRNSEAGSEQQDHLCSPTRRVVFIRRQQPPGGHQLDISTDGKFGEPATASNGKIIFTPYNADGVVFDPTDNSFALVDISSTISTRTWGLRLQQRQENLCSPNADGVECSIRATSFALVDISSTISTTSTAGRDYNGKIIFRAYADEVGDDLTDNSRPGDISSTISTDVNSSGLRLRQRQDHLPPYAADAWVYISTDNSFSLVDISSTISTDYKFLGAATASSKIFAPNDVDAVGVFKQCIRRATLPPLDHPWCRPYQLIDEGPANRR